MNHPLIILGIGMLTAFSLLLFGKRTKPEPPQKPTPQPFTPPRPTQYDIRQYMIQVREHQSVERGEEPSMEHLRR
jgi:hypothetical protein